MGLSGGDGGGIELTPRATINKAFTIFNIKLYTQIYTQMKMVHN